MFPLVSVRSSADYHHLFAILYVTRFGGWVIILATLIFEELVHKLKPGLVSMHCLCCVYKCTISIGQSDLRLPFLENSDWLFKTDLIWCACAPCLK